MNHKWKEGKYRSRCVKCGIIRYKKVFKEKSVYSGIEFIEIDRRYAYLTIEGELEHRPECEPNEILMRKLKGNNK